MEIISGNNTMSERTYRFLHVALSKRAETIHPLAIVDHGGSVEAPNDFVLSYPGAGTQPLGDTAAEAKTALNKLIELEKLV